MVAEVNSKEKGKSQIELESEVRVALFSTGVGAGVGRRQVGRSTHGPSPRLHGADRLRYSRGRALQILANINLIIVVCQNLRESRGWRGRRGLRGQRRRDVQSVDFRSSVEMMTQFEG